MSEMCPNMSSSRKSIDRFKRLSEGFVHVNLIRTIREFDRFTLCLTNVLIAAVILQVCPSLAGLQVLQLRWTKSRLPEEDAY